MENSEGIFHVLQCDMLHSLLR